MLGSLPRFTQLVLVLALSLAAGCSSPTSLCAPTTCDGCCDPSGTCRPGNTAVSCGARGAACSTCQFAVEICVDATCRAVSITGGGNATGGGNMGGGTGGGVGGGSGGNMGGGTGGSVGGGSGGGNMGGGTGGSMGGGSGGGSACVPESDSAFCTRLGAMCGSRSGADNCLTFRQVSSCGACPAGPANSIPSCSSGTCGFTCVTGFNRCNDQCVPNSVTSCGPSCAPCPPVTGGSAVCTVQGTCAATCNPGFHSCNRLCVPNDNVNTCGSSCAPCGAPVNGTATCNGTSCGFTCSTGFHPCANQCVPNTSVTTCGSSCSACSGTANGTATCDGVSCGLSCNPGFHLCGSTCVSDSSTSSCGSSCTPCAPPANSTATCVSGSCGFTCASGFNRCATQCLADSPTSCGPSCATCPAPQGSTATCTSGVCDTTCLAGYHKCAGVCVTDDDVDHCGTSCTPCPAGIEGSGRTCTRATSTSPYACGSACPVGTNTCPATGAPLVCAPAGYTLACGLSCSVCTGPAGQRGVCGLNGICSTDCVTRCGGICVSTATNNDHCGACGTACLPGQQCTQGECRASCATGVAFTTMLQTTTLATVDGTMAVADFDGDGRQDLVTAEGSTLRLRLGQTINGAATGTFGAAVYSSSAGATRLLTGDLTGDGRPELIALASGTLVMVYRWMGSPSYFTPYTFDVGLVPTSGVIAELNGVAPADLLLTFNTALANQSASVFVGTGLAGNPVNPVANPAGLGVSNIVAAQVGQLTADALPDLAVATGSSTVYLIPGTGLIAAPFNSAAAVVAQLPPGESFGTAPFELTDVIGDATADLVIPVQGPAHGARVFPLTVGPVVGGSTLLVSPVFVRALGAGDLNADGRRDLVLMGADLRLFRNLPNGLSGPEVLAGDFTAANGLYRLAVLDAVGDARADVLLRAASVAMVVPNVGGTFPSLAGFPVPNGEQLVTGDLNGDGRSDVAVVTQDADAGLAIVYANPNGGWAAGPVLPGDGYAPPVITELSQDAFNDLVTLTQRSSGIRLAAGGRLEVYMNGAWGTVCDDAFGLSDAMVACRQLRRGAAVSFRTVGGGAGSIWMDELGCSGGESSLMACSRSSNHDCGHSEDVGVECSSPAPVGASTLAVRFGSATGLSAATVLDQTGTVRFVQSADLNNDGLNDLAIVKEQRLEWLRNLGAGAFAPAAALSTTTITNDYVDELLVADVNNDGFRDLAFPYSSAWELQWWANTGSGALLKLPSTTGVLASSPSFAFDVSDDGKIDVVTTRGVYTGDGTGALALVGTPPVPMGPRVLLDLDNDGRVDLGGTSYAAPWLTVSRGAPVSSLFAATAENYWAGVPFVDVAPARLDSDASRDLVALIGRPGGRVLISLPGVCR